MGLGGILEGCMHFFGGGAISARMNSWRGLGCGVSSYKFLSSEFKA